VQWLATLAKKGKVYGIDHSKTSVAAAQHKNRQKIQSGQVDIRLGTVSLLPYPDQYFDLVSAVEMLYYWPEPVSDFREILRVLRPGGRLVVIGETYKGQRFGSLIAIAMKFLQARYLSLNEHRDLFGAAGYEEVAITAERTKGWICAVGRRRPSALSGLSPR